MSGPVAPVQAQRASSGRAVLLTTPLMLCRLALLEPVAPVKSGPAAG